MTGLGTGGETDATLRATNRGTSPASPGALTGGQAIGRYVVLRKAGAGAMGSVYAAYDPDLDRKVALKLLHEIDAPSQAQRLIDEAKVIAKISHPNVITVHDISEHDGRLFLAMEFVAGTTLTSWLGSKARGRRAIVSAFIQAGLGLAAAHDLDLVHRDFKPDNVMVDGEGAELPDGPKRVRVLDFGLAHLGDSDGPAMAGTPAYMAPEIYASKAASEASDQFSFCVALFEGLTGQRPFEGGSLVTLARNVCEGNQQRPPQYLELPSWLRRLLERGLATEPSQRWPSMHALVDELRRDRTRPRIVVGSATGLLLVAASALGYGQLDRARAQARCEATGEAIEAVWDDARVSQIEHAVLATAVPYAADTWARTQPRLSAFATAWTQARTQVCREADLEGTRSGEMLTLAEDCLTQARGAFEAQLTQMVDGGVDATTRAIVNAMNLPRPGDCTDRLELARRSSAPHESRDEVAAIKRDLASVAAMLEVGRLDAAKRLADEALVRADAVAWGPVQARARIVWADAMSKAGEHDAALPALQRAIVLAGGAGDHLAALNATTELIFLLGYPLYRSDEALALRPHAEMLLQRADLPSDDPRATRLMNSLGATYLMRGDAAEAKGYFQDQVELQTRYLGEAHPKLCNSMNNLALVESELGNVDGALALAEKVVAIRTESVGLEHPLLADSLSTYSVFLTRARRFEDAVDAAQAAIAINSAVYGADHPSVADNENNLVSNFIELKRFDEALVLAQRVVDSRRAQGSQNPELAGALQNLSIVLRSLGRLDAAGAAAREGAAINMAVFGEDHPLTQGARLADAFVRTAMGETDAARTMHARIVEVAEANADRPLLALDARLAWGKAEVEYGDHALALSHCDAVIERMIADEAIDDATTLWQARTCSARALWKLDREHARAIELMRAARDGMAAGPGLEASVASIDAWLSSASADSPDPPSGL